ALVAALACYGLGILTKESAAAAPALAFLALAARAEGGLGRRAAAAIRKGWPLYVASAAALAGVLALRTRILGRAIHRTGTGIYELENPLAPLPALPRAWNALILLVRYIGRTVFPLELTADESAWSLPVSTGQSGVGRLAVLLLLAAGLGALARLSARRAPAF